MPGKHRIAVTWTIRGIIDIPMEDTSKTEAMHRARDAHWSEAKQLEVKHVVTHYYEERLEDE